MTANKNNNTKPISMMMTPSIKSKQRFHINQLYSRNAPPLNDWNDNNHEAMSIIDSLIDKINNNK